MRVISRKILREFWEKHPDARQPLQTWYADVKHSTWTNPADKKNIYQNASFLGKNRIVFNVKGNKYRIVIVVQYQYEVVYIRFIGTHKEYDRINAETV